MSVYGSTIHGQTQFSSFSDDEKLNYALKLALSRVQTDLKEDWFREPADFAPKAPKELYKQNIPEYQEIKDYFIIDPNADGNDTPHVTNITVEILLDSGSQANFKLVDILDTTKVRENTTVAYINAKTNNSFKGRLTLLSRKMFTRYNYWEKGLTGKNSPDAGDESVNGIAGSGTKNDTTEPFNAFITWGSSGDVNNNRTWTNIYDQRDNPENNLTIFQNKLIEFAVALDIIAPENCNTDDLTDISKKHPFLKVYLNVPTYTTKSTRTYGINGGSDNLGFHNPVLSKSLGDVNGYPFYISAWDSSQWQKIKTTTYGATGNQDILYFLNYPGFLLAYGLADPLNGFSTSQKYPPMISFLRYEGETFEDGIITQGSEANLPRIANDKELFIDTTNNIIYRFDGGTKEWVSIGGGGGGGASINQGTELPDPQSQEIQEGELFIDTDDNKLYRFDGTQWVVLSGGDENLAKLDVSNTFSEKQTINSSLDVSGHLHVKGGVTSEGGFVNLSDQRVKTDIDTIEGATTKLRDLRGVYYTMNGSRHVGVVAQELNEIMPEAVFKMNNGYYGVEYGNLVGLLIQGFKEQDKRIKDLEQKLAEVLK